MATSVANTIAWRTHKINVPFVRDVAKHTQKIPQVDREFD
jgi:hypothetical protein